MLDSGVLSGASAYEAVTICRNYSTKRSKQHQAFQRDILNCGARYSPKATLVRGIAGRYVARIRLLSMRHYATLCDTPYEQENSHGIFFCSSLTH
jgi:hypothetical protein